MGSANRRGGVCGRMGWEDLQGDWEGGGSVTIRDIIIFDNGTSIRDRSCTMKRQSLGRCGVGSNRDTGFA